VKQPRIQLVLPFLLEVGCEEIPARFLSQAEKTLGERLKTVLTESGLLAEGAVGPGLAPAGTPQAEIETCSTPRRLTVHVPRILDRQPDRVEEIIGPPVRVAFDPEGKPTRAAESFAGKNAVTPRDLVRTVTAKGEYLAVRKTLRGRLAKDVLAEVLPEVILGVTFPKSMYWVAKSGPRFVRPIRWILALLGEGEKAHVVRFEVAGVKSGNFTYGHRALKSGVLRVKGFGDYLEKLLLNHVEVIPSKRRSRIVEESKALLERENLVGIEDDWLVDWTVNSVEWPRPMLGGFDPRFLSLPREILITVMRDHQKYFAIENGQGKLEARFLAFLNKDADAKGLIQQGHERVLTARFTDAEFFWRTDQRLPLAERAGLLSRVTYQANLGSYAEKVERMRAVAGGILGALESKALFSLENGQYVMRAIDLSKCDLTTQMVQEFTELQGVVGGLYAAAQGEPAEVADAVYDHYLPLGAEDRCPRSLVGAVVSLSDKLDSVVSGFAVGLGPTGSSDPFALRRQGNGVIKVILEYRLLISLPGLVETALRALNIKTHLPLEEVRFRVREFLTERLRYHLETICLFRYDTVRAVLAVGCDIPGDAYLRALALHNLRGSENLEALCVAAKRIKNILAKSASQSDWSPGDVDASLLVEDAERELYESYVVAERDSRAKALGGDYAGALETISALRPLVDTFFDKVLVMAEDRILREARLRLLGKLDRLFSGIAQFAELAAEAEPRQGAS
jgi:glycyl-tRNA synthetase beta chain